MNVQDFLRHADGLGVFLALLLMALSVSSWVVIVWKMRLLRRVATDVPRSVACFWQSASLTQALQTLPAFDRDGCVQAMVRASDLSDPQGLAGAGTRQAQLTRALREALDSTLQRLQWGQVLLATAGNISPFIGLLGTVWGIVNALTGMTEAGPLTIDRVAGPVGEALVMTAAGLAVAIPAVLGYNLLGRRIAQIEASLEGFAHDLCAVFGEPSERP